MNETLNEHVIMLAQQREYLDGLVNKVKDAEKLSDETPEYKAFIKIYDEYNKARKMEIMLYENVRNTALETSEQTNYDDKKPHPVTQIKKFNIVVITDEKQAKAWASKNAPSCLSLTKSKFNKVAKELEVDFVHTEIEYRAQVSKDLSEYVD